MTMNATLKQVSAITLLALLSSCAVVPVNSHYESARSLKKNNIEAAGHVTNYSDPGAGDSWRTSNNNFGFRVGYGVTDQFDVKLSYEHLMPDDNDFAPVNFISLSPKYTFVENVFAVKLPVSFYSLNDVEANFSDNVFAITPTVIGTLPVSQRFEAGLALSYQHFFDEDIDGFLGFNLGFGISSDLDKWSVRPELGYQFEPEGYIDNGFLNLGIAFTYNFDLNK